MFLLFQEGIFRFHVRSFSGVYPIFSSWQAFPHTPHRGTRWLFSQALSKEVKQVTSASIIVTCGAVAGKTWWVWDLDLPNRPRIPGFHAWMTSPRIGIPCKPSCATGILGWGVDPKHGALRKNPAAQHVIQANTFLVLGHAHTLWGIGSHSLQRCKCDKIPRFVDHWSQDPNAESAPVIPIHNIGDLYTVYWILNYLAVRKCGCGRTQKEGINKQPRLHETRNRWLLLVMIKPG